jgi:hypothetical protein
MIGKIERNMLRDFVKATNRKLDLYKGSQVELFFTEISDSCYACEIRHFGKVIADNIKNTDIIVMYLFGYAVGIGEEGVFEIWNKIVGTNRYWL